MQQRGHDFEFANSIAGAGRAPGTRARIKHAFKETSLGTISNWLVDVESRGASHTTSGPQMCKKRCKKRSAPQAAPGAQQQQQQPKTKTQKSSSWSAPKQPRDGACIEALDPQSTAAAIQAACAERDLVRKRALLEQLVEACSSFVTSAPMSQVAADELYAQRADLGPNPSKGRALGQEEVLDTWAGELGAWLAELDARVDDVADIAGKFLARNSGAQSAGQWHTDNVLQVTDEPTHRAVAAYGQGQVGLEFRFKGDDSITVKVLTPIGSMQIVSRALLCSPEIEHRHSNDGSGATNVTVIYDIHAYGGVVESSSAEDIQAASAAQPKLNFHEFTLEDHKGSVRKWGQRGGGSVWRLAVSSVAGPKTGGRGSRRAVRAKTVASLFLLRLLGDSV